MNQTALKTGPFGSLTFDGATDLGGLVQEIGARCANAHQAGRVRERFDAELWRTLEAADLTRLTSSPSLGAGPKELSVVLYGLARCAAAIPIAETDLLAAWLAEQAGHDIPAGPLTVAITESDTERGRLKGSAEAPWSGAANAIVLAASVGTRTHVAILGVEDVDVDERHNLAGEPRDQLVFDLPFARFVTLDGAIGQELRMRGAWARCVQVLGALDAVVESCLVHTRARIQFGRVLSDFQSVQHALAAMVGEVERSRAAVALAVAAAIDHGYADDRSRYAIATAKVVLGQTVTAVNTVAHQLHGAIGVTIEHRLWRSTMRAQSWIGEFGTAGHYARELGYLALGADDVWDLVTTGTPRGPSNLQDANP